MTEVMRAIIRFQRATEKRLRVELTQPRRAMWKRREQRAFFAVKHKENPASRPSVLRFFSFSICALFFQGFACGYLGDGRNTVSRALFGRESSLSFGVSSVSPATNSVNSLLHTNDSPRGTH